MRYEISREISRLLAEDDETRNTRMVANAIIRAALPGARLINREAVIIETRREIERIRAIRYQRAKAHSVARPSLAGRLYALRRRWADRLADSIRNAIDYRPTRGDVEVRFGGDGRGEPVTVRTRETDEGRYSSRYRYRMMRYDLTVTADPRSRVVSRDGVAMIVPPGAARRLGRVTVERGWVITRGRGYQSFNAKDGWRIAEAFEAFEPFYRSLPVTVCEDAKNPNNGYAIWSVTIPDDATILLETTRYHFQPTLDKDEIERAANLFGRAVRADEISVECVHRDTAIEGIDDWRIRLWWD